MSVLDEFQAAEQRVRARLAELRPLAEEFHQLEKLAAQFGIKPEPVSASSGSATARVAATAAKTSSARGRSAGRRATAKRTSGRKPGQTASRRASAQGAKGAGRKSAAAAARSRSASKSLAGGARGSAAKTGGSRGRRGVRGEQLAAIVRRRPGITVRDAANEMRVDATSLYRVVRQLEQEGRIKKQGRELQPA